MLAQKLAQLENIDNAPPDLPEGKTEQLSWKRELAQKITEYLWVAYPESFIQEVLRAASQGTDVTSFDDDESFECAKCFTGKTFNILEPNLVAQFMSHVL